MADNSIIRIPVQAAFVALVVGQPLLAEGLEFSVLKNSAVARLLSAYGAIGAMDGADRVFISAAVLGALALRSSVSSLNPDVLPLAIWGHVLGPAAIKSLLEEVDQPVEFAFSLLEEDAPPQQLLHVWDVVLSAQPSIGSRVVRAVDFLQVQPAGANAPAYVSAHFAKVADLTFGHFVKPGHGGQDLVAMLLAAAGNRGRAADRVDGSDLDLVTDSLVALIDEPGRSRPHLEVPVSKKLCFLTRLPLQFPFGVFSEGAWTAVLPNFQKLAVISTAPDAIAEEFAVLVEKLPNVKLLVNGSGNPLGVAMRVSAAVLGSEGTNLALLEALNQLLDAYGEEFKKVPYDAMAAATSIIDQQTLKKAQLAAIISGGDGGAGGGGSLSSANNLLSRQRAAYDSGAYTDAAAALTQAQASGGSLAVLRTAAAMHHQFVVRAKVTKKPAGNGDEVGTLVAGAAVAAANFFEGVLRNGGLGEDTESNPKFGNAAPSISAREADLLLSGKFNLVDWHKVTYEFYVGTCSGAVAAYPHVVPISHLPDVTLRIDVVIMLLRAAGVPEPHVNELGAYVNDIAKYTVDSPVRRAVITQIISLFMKTLADDYASGVAGPLSENAITLRGGPTSAAGVAYGVFNKNRATEHERAQQQRSSGAEASPSKRRQPDTDSSVSPPTKHGSQNGEVGAYAANGKKNGVDKWKAGSKVDKVRFSADGTKMSIGPHVYDYTKFGVDVKAKAQAGKQAALLKCAAAFMLNEGGATVKQRLVYSPKGTTSDAVTGQPFAGFKASNYHRRGEKADFA
jgi:hypothetical protein